MSDGNQTTDSDGEAAHEALANFWHPNNPAANADMSMKVTRAIRAARLQERERCARLVRDLVTGAAAHQVREALARTIERGDYD